MVFIFNKSIDSKICCKAYFEFQGFPLVFYPLLILQFWIALKSILMRKLLLKKFMTITRIIAICLLSSLGWSQTPPPTTLFPNQVYAGNNTTVGQLSVSSSGSLKFYTVPSGGTSIPISTLLVDNTTYYLSQTITGVESTSRVAIKVRRISESTQTLNAVSTVANLVTTPSNGSTPRWYNVAGGGSPLPSTTVLTTGNYYVDQTIPAGVSTLLTGLQMPYALALQSDGKVLMSEANGGVIKRMDADGTNSVNLITGLNGPYAMALQADGKIVFAESGAGVTPTAIKRANANGTGVQTLYTGDASQEFFAVAIDADGKILFSDQSYVYRINPDGTGITTLTSPGDVLGPQGLFVQNDGKILIADSFNGAIKRIDPDGANLTTLVSGLNFPRTIASLSNGKFLVTELMSGKIISYNADWTSPVVIGNSTNFTNPSGLGVINDGRILVTDTDSNSLKLLFEASNTNRTLVGVTIIPMAPSTTWTKQIYTGSKTVSDLQVVGNNIKWYSTASGGTALNSSTILVSGSTYYATQTVSGIESTSRLAITVNKISETSQVVPNGSTIADLVITPSAGATVQWFSSASGGTALSTSQPLSNGLFYVEENNSGVTSNRVSVVVSVAPAAPTTLYPTQIYKGDTNTVSSLQATGTQVKWYTTPTGGTALPNSTLLTDNMTYYASQTVSFVESFTRVAVTVKRISNATQNLISGNTVADLITTPSPTAIVEWFSVPSGGTALPSNTVLSNAMYYVQQTLSGVVSNRISVQVILTTPAPTTLYSVQVYTSAKTLANLQVTGSAIKWYSAATGGSALATNTVVTDNGTYYASQTVSGIESTTRLAVGTKWIAASSQTMTSTQTVSDLVVTPSTGGSVQWYSQASGGTPLVGTSLLTNGNYYIEQTISGVVSNRELVVVSVYTVRPSTNFVTQVFTGNDKTLADLQVSGIDVKWYNNSSGGVVLPLSTVLTDDTYYFASQTINGIESAQRRGILVNRISDAIQNLLAGSTVANLIATPTANTTARWYDVASGGTPLASTAVLVSGTYYVDQFSPISNRVPVTINVNTLSIDTNEKKSVKLYPNPSKGIFYLNVTENVTVSIYTVLGAIVLEKEIQPNEAIDLSNQPKGVYFVKLISKDFQYKDAKVIKE